jgi:hypothetical protein
LWNFSSMHTTSKASSVGLGLGLELGLGIGLIQKLGIGPIRKCNGMFVTWQTF